MLPRWRELQPLLIRSAGVVGIVATIMAVVSSDALRLGGESPRLGGRNDSVADLARAEPTATPPIIAASSELRSGETIDQMRSPPIRVVAVEKAAPSAVLSPLTPADLSGVADLRTGREPDPASSGAVPLTTASVARAQAEVAPPAVATASAAPADAPALASAEAAVNEISQTAPRPTTAPPITADQAPSPFPSDAAACPRDWVSDPPGGSADGATNCTATDTLIASVSSDQSALEEAATELAQDVAATIPRLPIPRPDVVPVIVTKPVRVSRASSSGWPSDPPPNCPAGQRAKWRFVDRKVGTKAWYCR